MATNRRIYEAVAKTVNREMRFSDWDDSDRRAMAAIVRGIASDFKDDNIRFKKDKFYEACGLTDQGYPHLLHPIV